ncbi:SET domain-containing protein-lysine N-methyltransferase [Candidatus Woesearchaeota archaeon]|nr:SET domain-containing protein-lysine N-methyltransferase [Candidatus Woesearchaeota archaeon]
MVYSWLSPKAQTKKSSIEGTGTFCKTKIHKDELICVFGGHIFDTKTWKTLDESVGSLALPLNEEFVIALHHLSEAGDGDFVNHSCNPNAGIHGQIFLVAMREIEAGEEITFDYAVVLADIAPQDCEFDCHCGAISCRGKITAHDWKRDDLQHKYAGYFSHYIQQKINYIEEMKKRGTSPLVVIKESAIHNKGGYAACDIAKGTKIIQYVGEKLTKEVSNRRCEEQVELAKTDPSCGEVYIFELDDQYDIDGNVPYNTARFLNHSCEPNCRDVNDNGEIWIVAIRDIKKGEELLYNYRFGLDDFQDFPCRCGSPRCFGYILDEEDWADGRDILSQKK